MEIVNLPISRLVMNHGQIDGVPANPRQWTQTDVDTIAKSLAETPELFAARPCLVFPLGKDYILLGGNLRYCGAKQNGDKQVPCIVFPADTPAAKLKEIVIKDNGSFGAWDYEALANEWDDLPLVDWGVPAWDVAPFDESALDDLFEEAGEGKDKGIKLTVEIPLAYEDKVEDIRQSISLTLDEWKGCTVK